MSTHNPKQNHADNSLQADGKMIKERKQEKWLAKQEQKSKRQRIEQDRNEWFEQNKSFATFVTASCVGKLRSEDASGSDRPLKNLDDDTICHLLRPYLNLQEPSGRLFIAEGTETVRLLIQQLATVASEDGHQNESTGPLTVQSIFVKPSVLFDEPVSLLKDVEQSRKIAGVDFHVLVGDASILGSVAGFQISRGALACGVIPDDRTEDWLKAHLSAVARRSGYLRLLALDGICDTANMGSMIRTASAFGVHAIILSRSCCDPWYRRSVRVSMGHVFRVPCVRVCDLSATLSFLSSATFEQAGVVTTYAAVVDRDADLVLEHIDRGSLPKSFCCVMGNEGAGASEAVVRASTRTLRIDMAEGVDSLSVPVATGILLHGLCEKTRC